MLYNIIKNIKIMKKLVLGLLVFGLTSQLFSQVNPLPVIEISAVNYEYLDAVDSYDLDIDVKKLEVAAYDKNGDIIRTIERFKDVALPVAVRKSISKNYPGWYFKKDIYRVTYNQEGSKKVYKVLLTKGNQTIKVRTDENGYFLNGYSL
jgi:hypothetical protein